MILASDIETFNQVRSDLHCKFLSFFLEKSANLIDNITETHQCVIIHANE